MKTKFNGILTLFLAFIVQITFAQEKTISGTISDETGPLPGVSIMKKGTSQGTETDFDGKYSIKAKTGDVLVISFIGMKTEYKTIGSSTNINIVMQNDNVLDEIVVTAYGTVKKEALTGAIAEIKSEELAKVASGNALAGLSGKVAGVQFYSNTGQPGAAPILRFRGIGSLNGSSAPLYVVDGVPFNGNIATINPSDIASISFVKDASAASLYGNRGANGVVILTTKKGKKGKLKINLDIKNSITGRSIKDYDVMTDASEYITAYHKLIKNNQIVNNGLSESDAGILASEGLFDDPNFGLVYNPFGGDRTSVVGTDGTFNGGDQLWDQDWRDYLLRSGSIETYYLSVSGGTEKTNFFVSAGHENNKGININSGFKRSTLKTSVETNIRENIKTGIDLSYANRLQKTTLDNNITGNFAWIRDIAPIYPVFAVDHATGALALDANGNKQWDWADVFSPNATAGRPISGFSNPHALQSLNVNNSDRNNLTTRMFAKIDFLQDFSFTYTFGYDFNDFEIIDYTNNKVGSAASADINGRLDIETGRNTTITNQQLLTWKKNLADTHNFEVLLGHESSNFDANTNQVFLRNQLLSGDISADLFAVQDGNDGITGNVDEYNLEGYFARLLYDYDGKYYVNGSIRRDGSSVFHPDNKWGTFFGAGLAWVVSKESFLSDVSWLNNFKLKASYGELGNDIVYYPGTAGTERNYAPYLDQWDVTKNGEYFDLAKTVIGNKDLKWETSTNINVGFESSFFNNKLSIEGEYFIRSISDLIHNRDLPSSTGFPSVPENVMSMQNKGIEAIINYTAIDKEDFKLDLSFNATHYKNEITDIVEGKDFVDNPDFAQFRWQEGSDAYEYHLREYVGINPDNGNAIWRTDTEIDPTTGLATDGLTEDYSITTEYFTGKSALPDLYGGFSLNLTYKNFDLGVDLAYQIGGYSYDFVYNDGFDGSVGNNFHKDFYDTWTYDNTTALLPRIDEDTFNWSQFSDFFLIESDYISLNNVTLGYSIPTDITNKLNLSSVRLYTNINNAGLLWTKGDRDGFDPRQRVAGNSNAVRYPSLATYTLGLNINF